MVREAAGKPLAVGLAALTLALAGACSPPLAGPSRSLPASGSRGIERHLAAAETHTYTLPRAPGEILTITVEQRGVDVELRLVAGGDVRTRIDSPNGRQGVERLWTLADDADQVLEIVAEKDRGGSYGLSLERRPGDDGGRAKVLAEGLFARAEGARREGTGASRAAARELLATAREAFAALGDEARLADCQDRRGRLALLGGHGAEAAEAYASALPALRRQHRPADLADALNGLGQAYRLLGRASEALPLHEEAERIFAALGIAEGEARSLDQQGRTLDAAGRSAEAFGVYERELAAWRRAEQPLEVGLTFANRGRLRAALGDFEGAQADFATASPLLAAAGRVGDVASLEIDLGPVLFWLGRPLEARTTVRRALVACRRRGDRAEEAKALANLAWLELGQGVPTRAAELAHAAGARFARLGQPEGQALANLLLGRAHLDRSRLEDAEAALAAARATFGAAGHRAGLAATAQLLARVDLARGDLDRAQEWSERALGEIETLRDDVAPGDHRSALLAKQGDIYEVAIEVLARRELAEPGRGFGWQALAVAEQARARSLLDTLGSPRGTLGAAELSRRHPPPGTVEVVYALGQGQSWVFVRDRAALRLWPLAGRDVLEAAARQARFLLAEGDRVTSRGQTAAVLEELSRELLAPWLPSPPPARLLIVPDGALAYVPFAALPRPEDPAAAPLLTTTEITYAPSLSTRARLAERASRQTREALLAVVADPVFSAADPRFRGHRLDTVGAPAFPRLVHSGREADALIALAGPRPSFLATGFAARRELLGSHPWTAYAYLHFATHAVVDPRMPARSGLALSHLTPDGTPVDGFVRVPELARLQLAADLVVLSACESAGGRQVRGEGLVGLVQAFFESGARAVLVSLFPVEDQDAAELMVRFYQGLLVAGRPPAQALRAAQRSMLDDPGRAAPAHWGAWVLLGADGENSSPHR
ncbi:MAG: CHAT domain-containing tetratricopeptide repeat protein [Thermoanaerobaculia bacterium]|nr:CHAT domain-containing tetratricopeptide repeat protein [Thermoanaerobaculia bacterium]